jgi:ribosomal protein L28
LTYYLIYSKIFKEKGGFIMAIKVTNKKPLVGNKRSHALNATKMVQKPNLQKKTIDGKKVIISAREAKKIK